MKGTRLLMLGLIVVSLIGLADALYLAVATYTDTPIICGPIEGCNDVAKSPYTRILGIPLSVFGTGYYLIALAIVLSMIEWGSARARGLMFTWAIAGVLFSLYTLYLQAVVIDAWCIYCIISEIATVLLLALSFPLSRHQELRQPMLQ